MNLYQIQKPISLFLPLIHYLKWVRINYSNKILVKFRDQLWSLYLQMNLNTSIQFQSYHLYTYILILNIYHSYYTPNQNYKNNHLNLTKQYNQNFLQIQHFITQSKNKPIPIEAMQKSSTKIHQYSKYINHFIAIKINSNTPSTNYFDCNASNQEHIERMSYSINLNNILEYTKYNYLCYKSNSLQTSIYN